MASGILVGAKAWIVACECVVGSLVSVRVGRVPPVGVKDWFICYADGDVPSVLAKRPELDRAATDAPVRRLFPNHTVTPDRDGTLTEDANPEDDMVFAAVWPSVTIVCTTAVWVDGPTRLDARFLAEGMGRTVYLHLMHSFLDSFALGVWGPDGQLQRALSLNCANAEILENIGDPLAFERPYWAGDFPVPLDDNDRRLLVEEHCIEDFPFPFARVSCKDGR